MSDKNFPEVVKEIHRKDGRYAKGAYFFIREALDHTLKSLEKDSRKNKGHVSGEELLEGIRDFEEAYNAYNEFQRKMEKYWCLCWLLQGEIKTTKAIVIKENYVRLDCLPLVIRVPSLPEIFPETFVELEILQIDLLELTVNTKFTRKLEE